MEFQKASLDVLALETIGVSLRQAIKKLIEEY